jgi:hypothetical protein
LCSTGSAWRCTIRQAPASRRNKATY